MNILITSGGCKVPIDSVRHIGNFSSGRYGADLAGAALLLGHHVTHFRERGSYMVKGDKEDLWFHNYRVEEYNSYQEYLDFAKFLVDDGIELGPPYAANMDLIISSAAISDYVPADVAEGKISSDKDELTIRLKRAEKVLPLWRKACPMATIVGFKLLCSPSEEEKLDAIGRQLSVTDMTVYNDLDRLRAGDGTRSLFYRDNGSLVSRDFKTADDLLLMILGRMHTKTRIRIER